MSNEPSVSVSDASVAEAAELAAWAGSKSGFPELMSFLLHQCEAIWALPDGPVKEHYLTEYPNLMERVARIKAAYDADLAAADGQEHRP